MLGADNQSGLSGNCQKEAKMLTRKLHPVVNLAPLVWMIVIVGSFALGAFADTIFAAALSPRAPRGELPESNIASPSSSIVFTLPREPQESIRGGLAEAYSAKEHLLVVTVRPAIHSEERIAQALEKYESPEMAVSAPSEYPLKIRGGLAESRALETQAAPVSKQQYAPHSDAWTDLVLDRFASTDVAYLGIVDYSKLRGGPLE
jgi:hypothetical protein